MRLLLFVILLAMYAFQVRASEIIESMDGEWSISFNQSGSIQAQSVSLQHVEDYGYPPIRRITPSDFSSPPTEKEQELWRRYQVDLIGYLAKYYISSGLIEQLEIKISKGTSDPNIINYLSLILTETNFTSAVARIDNQDVVVADMVIAPAKADLILANKLKSNEIGHTEFLNYSSVILLNHYYELKNSQVVFPNGQSVSAAAVGGRIGRWVGERIDAGGDNLADIGDGLADAIDGVGGVINRIVDTFGSGACTLTGVLNVSENVGIDETINAFSGRKALGAGFSASVSATESHISGDVSINYRSYNMPGDITCTPVAITNFDLKVDLVVDTFLGDMELELANTYNVFNEMYPIIDPIQLWSSSGTNLAQRALLDGTLYFSLAWYMKQTVGVNFTATSSPLSNVASHPGDVRVTNSIEMACGLSGCSSPKVTNIQASNFGDIKDNIHLDTGFGYNLDNNIGLMSGLVFEGTVLSLMQGYSIAGTYSEVQNRLWGYSGSTCGDIDFDGANDYVQGQAYEARLYGAYFIDAGVALINPIKYNLVRRFSWLDEDSSFWLQNFRTENQLFAERIAYIDIGSDVSLYKPEIEVTFDGGYGLRVKKRSCIPFDLDVEFSAVWNDGYTGLSRPFIPGEKLSLSLESNFKDVNIASNTEVGFSVEEDGSPFIVKSWAWLISIISSLL